MPSPFPGMDPYLEDPTLWPDVHQRLIAYISEDLQSQVLPKYITRIGERIEISELGKGYYPDAMIVQPPGSTARSISEPGVLVADKPLVLRYLDPERRVPYIKIVYRSTGDVVTVIEVLNPANKNGVGRKQYLQKQDDLFTTQVNLVEIDLLSLENTPTIAGKAISVTPPKSRYVVSVSRLQAPADFEFYFFGLQDRLPRCGIPLRAADPDVVLDLPSVFARCYAVGRYDLLIDYTKLPPVSLNESEAAWIHTHLKHQP